MYVLHRRQQQYTPAEMVKTTTRETPVEQRYALPKAQPAPGHRNR